MHLSQTMPVAMDAIVREWAGSGTVDDSEQQVPAQPTAPPFLPNC